MVKIQSISDPVKDSNGKNYKIITLEAPAFKEVVDLSTGESILALASPKTVKKCVWEESYLDGSKHYMYDANEGQAVYGTIYTASTDEYEIDGRNKVKNNNEAGDYLNDYEGVICRVLV